MKYLTTGEPSTLATWRALSAKYFGEHSIPTQWLDTRIRASSPDEPVDAEEGPMLHELGRLAAGKFLARRFTDAIDSGLATHDALFADEFERVSAQLPHDSTHPVSVMAATQTQESLVDTTARIMSYAHATGIKLAAGILAKRL